MKRTTIYLAADLEVRLKQEVARRGRPMAELIREAVEVYLAGAPGAEPPGAGAFASGHGDTAARADEILAEGFGEDATQAPARRHPKPTRRTKRRA